jgi:uncharacterized protein (DUF433 family)
MQTCLIELNSGDEPVISGTGVTVAAILERLCSDDSVEKICSDHHLTKEQVHAALSYAEMILPRSKHFMALDSTRDYTLTNGTEEQRGARTWFRAREGTAQETSSGDIRSGEGLDYSLLAENAGYFRP